MPPQSTPAQPSAAPPPPTQTTTGPVVADGTPAPQAVVGSPKEIYQGLREKREVLMNQKDRLQNERQELQQQLRQGPASDADRAGLEQQLAQVDQRIAQVSLAIEEANVEVAAAAAVPGALARDPRPDPWVNGPPEELVAIGMSLMAVLLFPICLAWARRLWKKAAVVSAVPPELTDRIGQMERNLDAVAVEIERIGEGQRFVTQLLAQRSEPKREALPEPRRES